MKKIQNSRIKINLKICFYIIIYSIMNNKDIHKTFVDIYEIISGDRNFERNDRLKILNYIVKEQQLHKIKPIDVKELINIIDTIIKDLTNCITVKNTDENIKTINKLESIKKSWIIDYYVEGDKYEISHDTYLQIDDYDINIYDGKNLILIINTFPNDPKIILKLINHFN